MRVVGYVREVPGPEAGDTVFAQSERVRRWVQANGYHLVAMCQDPRSSDQPEGREGYGALLGILSAEQADMVVLSSLSALSADKIDQEIMLSDLRSRCGAVAVADEAEQEALSDPSPDAARRFVRDVLEKRETYGRWHQAEVVPGAPEVVVQFVRPAPPPGEIQAS